MQVLFDIGEDKHVRVKIFSQKDENFEIIDARWELRKSGKQEMEDSGICDIYEHEIDSKISPKEIGKYYLKIIYHIADETLIEMIDVRVV